MISSSDSSQFMGGKDRGHIKMKKDTHDPSMCRLCASGMIYNSKTRLHELKPYDPKEDKDD